MFDRKNKPLKNKSEKVCPTIIERLNAEKRLIKKLKEQKKAYGEFLSQIDNFIDYAKDQAENNDSDELRLKYEYAVEEEESLQDKIRESIKKNDELIELVKKSNFNLNSKKF